jgi:hypothetical protein
MTLQEYIDSVTEKRQFEIAINIIKPALPIWDKFAESNSLTYIDSVIAIKHTVDKNILKDAIADIESYFFSSGFFGIATEKKPLLKRIEQFSDPIVSLQDSDWELPYEVEQIFYSVYNLLQAVNGKKQTVFDESIYYISINQAIDALETSKTLSFEEIQDLLYKS